MRNGDLYGKEKDVGGLEGGSPLSETEVHRLAS